ncbi:MAG TPA: hypothetical protein DCP97_04410, partial [Ruminococcaceae bacterium]|nr:hypothetical protein [Oscillospiraceae bacterium]
KPASSSSSSSKAAVSASSGSKASSASSSGGTQSSALSSKPASSSSKTSSSNAAAAVVPASSGEVRAAWISYLDFNTILKNKTKAEFTANIGNVFDNLLSIGLNTAIVQVRPFADALYPSEYFPWSSTITGTEGQNPGFDPLAIMVEQAKKRGMRIEAWINPYRVRNASSSAALSANNQAQIWLNEGNESVVKTSTGIFYDPASKQAQQLIINGVKELVTNYDIDAIHMDDYFYPTTDASFDANSYNAYKSGGGTLALADWRRENVNTLVRGIYSAIKSINSSVKFGISPQGNMNNNYNTQYIDVAKWLSNKGYIDYICPQVYFGFENAAQPFSSTVAQFNDMIKVSGIELYVGLAPYKLGCTDQWAGAGKTEWQNTTDILARMVQDARSNSKYAGFAMFRYGSMFNPAADVKSQVETEMANLKAVLK